jgi:hypothetical protein
MDILDMRHGSWYCPEALLIFESCILFPGCLLTTSTIFDSLTAKQDRYTFSSSRSTFDATASFFPIGAFRPRQTSLTRSGQSRDCTPCPFEGRSEATIRTYPATPPGAATPLHASSVFIQTISNFPRTYSAAPWYNPCNLHNVVHMV